MQKFLKINNIDSHKEKGITIITVSNQAEGIVLAKKLLYFGVNQETVLYLSGGSTPQQLYQQLADEKKIVPGAVGMVDERFGTKWHEQSNEAMMRTTGLLDYFVEQNIPFYPLLQNKSREATAQAYDEQVRQLHERFSKSIGVLGIGLDGHTAGIAPNRKDFHNPLFDQSRSSFFVSEFNDSKSFYGERITMTFAALSMMDALLVLAFGSAKQKALKALFTAGDEVDVPARFYIRPEIAQKSILITDQYAL